jgi:heme-degrading monooxygenase HmoA
MSSIRVEDGYLTLFNIFHTDGADDQQRLFDQWRSLPPGHTQPGLIAGNFHRGFDGRSVINYAQWESKAAYDAFTSETATQRRLNEALSFSQMDSVTCEVIYTGNPAPELTLENPWFTVVIVVTTDPDHQGEVLKEIISNDPGPAEVHGYVSHAVHRGLSGEHVIEYAQWQDEESFRSFAGQPREPSPIDSLTTAELYVGRLEYIRSRS